MDETSVPCVAGRRHSLNLFLRQRLSWFFFLLCVTRYHGDKTPTPARKKGGKKKTKKPRDPQGLCGEAAVEEMPIYLKRAAAVLMFLKESGTPGCKSNKRLHKRREGRCCRRRQRYPRQVIKKAGLRTK